MEFEQIKAFVFVLLSLCGGIAAIAGACAAIVKFWRYAHRDTDRNSEQLTEFETYLASDKRRIERLEQQQEATSEQNKLLLKAVVALMGHELDGNHTQQITDVRDEIQEYLITK